MEAINHDHMKLITPELIEAIVSYMKLQGSCYLYKIQTGSKITELMLLRPDMMTVEKNNDGSVKKWTYTNGGNVSYFTPDEIIVFANFNPYQTYPNVTHGYSETQACAITL